MFTNDIWTMQDISATDNLADPVWRARMTTMFNDCIDIAETIPQALLDNNTLSRIMGPLARFMKFNMCKKVTKTKQIKEMFYRCEYFQMFTKQLCGAAQASRMVSKFNGDEMNVHDSEFGVRDKAMVVAMVMTESLDPVKDFINQVLH